MGTTLLEITAREMDDERISLKESAEIVSESLEIPYGKAKLFLSAKRKGFVSCNSYLEHLVKTRIGSGDSKEYSSLREFLLSEKRIGEQSRLLRLYCLKEGFSSSNKYYKTIKKAKKIGMTLTEYLLHLSENLGYDSLEDFKKDLPEIDLNEKQSGLIKLVNPQSNIIKQYSKNGGRESHNEKLIQELVEKLPKKERSIILDRYFRNKTLREIGAALGISGERVRQLEKTILEKIKIRYLERIE